MTNSKPHELSAYSGDTLNNKLCENREKNLGIYVHIPYCKSRCVYCSFVSGTNCGNQNEYINSLTEEITIRSKELNGIVADTIYVGGGTPSMLNGGLLSRIIHDIKMSFNVCKSAEITVEANPDSAGLQFINECAGAGINRISFGVQSANDSILKQVNRPHNFDDFTKAAALCKTAGISNISADVMLGLPTDTVKGVCDSVYKILEQGVNHVSIYSLKVEEGTPLYRTGFISDDDLQAEMYEACFNIMQKNSFNRYEVSNFCKAGYKSRHNLKYWNRSPYVGLGVAAHSFYNGNRYENTDNISKYIIGNNMRECSAISGDEAIEEYVMLGLRTEYGIDLDELKNDYGYDILQHKRAQIEKLISLNMIKRADNKLILQDSAYYVMNSVICELI